MRDRTTITLLLLAAVAGCEGVTETPDNPSGEEVIAAFASAFAEFVGIDEPLPVSVSGGWDRIAYPAIAAAVGKYVEETGTAVKCWATTETGTVCPGSNPWVFLFESSGKSTTPNMIEVDISTRDWLHGASVWCAEVTTVGTSGWKIGRPEQCGSSSYTSPGDRVYGGGRKGN